MLFDCNMVDFSNVESIQLPYLTKNNGGLTVQSLKEKAVLAFHIATITGTGHLDGTLDIGVANG
jgi:hypothetical protein